MAAGDRTATQLVRVSFLPYSSAPSEVLEKSLPLGKLKVRRKVLRLYDRIKGQWNCWEQDVSLQGRAQGQGPIDLLRELHMRCAVGDSDSGGPPKLWLVLGDGNDAQIVRAVLVESIHDDRHDFKIKAIADWDVALQPVRN